MKMKKAPMKKERGLKRRKRETKLRVVTRRRRPMEMTVIARRSESCRSNRKNS
jgi:hypothetical protein